MVNGCAGESRRPSFQELQNVRLARLPIIYQVVDLLHFTRLRLRETTLSIESLLMSNIPRFYASTISSSLRRSPKG